MKAPQDLRRVRPPAAAKSDWAPPSLRSRPFPRRRSAPELTAARVLCRALRRKRERAEKKRIVHLICLNLLAILRRRTQRV